ncbi:hypothetical protein GCM10017562_65010 [Streptomyces roseofulvus]|uniref:phosphotransferase n=1 Tax=Streptomyces roseofulvus TaxID=33902 RepID=UPI0031FCADCC
MLAIDGSTPPEQRDWLWHTPSWRAEACAWVSHRLADHGIRPAGPLEQLYTRPYATIMRLPTDQGVVWFKANGPGYRHEARVLRELRGWAGTRVPHVLAEEADHGWFLTADAGPPLSSILATEPALSHWETVLSEYAALQVESTAHLDTLKSLGVPDKSPAAMPGVLADVLADDERLLGPDPGLDHGELDALHAGMAEFNAQCVRLDAIGIAYTIQHDDLTPGNVLMPATGPVFIDWTDACVAHPFASLTYPIRHVMQQFAVGSDSPEVRRVKDAYFEAWAGRHSRAELDEAAELAIRLAVAGKVTAWRSALQGLDRSPLGPYFQYAEARWLRKLLSEGASY